MYRGIILSVTASCLFAAQYYLAAVFPDMSAGEIFGWRTLITFPFVTLFLIVGGELRAVSQIITRMKKSPFLLAGLILSSMLMTVQQWLFIWGPLNGRGLNVSLGYFLLPLVMLTTGYVIYREHLSGIKKLAALSAIVALCHELYQAGGFSWEALTVSLGMTAYFILRRTLQTGNLGGFWFDMVFMLPVAIWFILHSIASGGFMVHSSGEYFMVALIGIVSAAASIAYITASRHLSFSLFGLMGYVEPVLLVIVSLLLGESIKSEEWLTYIPIWTAVALLVLDGALVLSQRAKSPE